MYRCTSQSRTIPQAIDACIKDSDLENQPWGGRKTVFQSTSFYVQDASKLPIRLIIGQDISLTFPEAAILDWNTKPRLAICFSFLATAAASFGVHSSSSSSSSDSNFCGDCFSLSARAAASSSGSPAVSSSISRARPLISSPLYILHMQSQNKMIDVLFVDVATRHCFL